MYVISIKPTNNPAIIKFESNVFLVKGKGHEFSNIEDAKPSPIAQQLFHLPFVKKVYIASNFIAIEKYNIVEWDDVAEEVAEQIQSYLNSDGSILHADADVTKKTPVSVYAEITPNPSSMKFVANKKLVTSTHEFSSLEESRHSPLAMRLFQFPFVKNVFLDDNFVTITKLDHIDWQDITLELREFIRDFIDSGELVVEENQVREKSTSQSNEQEVPSDPISNDIISILDEYIKPAVAGDGGNILFKSYSPNTKTVEVVLQGACSGCPSSTMTLKNGIETLLKDMLKGKVESVVALNG